MTLRVAVATEDGVEVQHFGHATRFSVYDLDRMEIRPVGSREDAPSFAPCEERAAAHQRKVELLRDCQALIVARVGPHALRLIEAQGIAVYESETPVAEALEELAAAEALEPAAATGNRPP
jgi:nitrogen fixation protein NifB